jgi:hypothetical protein
VRLVAVLGSATAPGRLHRAVAEAVERAGRRDELSVEPGGATSCRSS